MKTTQDAENTELVPIEVTEHGPVYDSGDMNLFSPENLEKERMALAQAWSKALGVSADFVLKRVIR